MARRRRYWDLLTHCLTDSVPDLGTQSQCSRQLESKCGPCGPCYESTSLSIRAITSSSSPSRDIGNMLPFGYSRRTDSLLATCSLNWFAIGNFIGNKQLGKNFKYLCVIIRFPTPRARTHTYVYKNVTDPRRGGAGWLQWWQRWDCFAITPLWEGLVITSQKTVGLLPR